MYVLGGTASGTHAPLCGACRRDAVNLCFRLRPLAASLRERASAANDEPVAQLAEACMGRLAALGIAHDAAGDRSGVGCCNPGCENLAGWEEAGLALSRCADCAGVRYCSVRCQKADWARHKPACKAAAAAAREVARDAQQQQQQEEEGA